MKNLPSKKLLLYRAVSVLITFIGLALIIYMVTVEGELGLLPLLLLLIGITASIYFHIKLKKNKAHF